MIRAYIGLQGSGKTFSMVNDALKIIDSNISVVSNTPIFDKEGEIIIEPDEGKQFWDKFVTKHNTLFIVDEGGVVFGKYNWKNIPNNIWYSILLHRKFGNHIFYASPRFQDTAIQMREYTYEAVDCKPVKFPGLAFRNIYYDPIYFEYKKEDLPLKFEKDFIRKRKFISNRRAKYMFKRYDTKFTINPYYDISSIEMPQPHPDADESIIGQLLY